MSSKGSEISARQTREGLAVAREGGLRLGSRDSWEEELQVLGTALAVA